MPRLDSIGKTGFEKVTPFFLEAEGLTHSRVFFVDILIGCEVHEYRCRIVVVSSHAIANRVLPREVAQAVMIPTTLVSSWVGDVGKELPRTEPVTCMSFQGGRSLSTSGNLPSMHVPGIPQGQPL